jgi:DNA-binding transcriptional LysR family regulator
LPLFKYWKDAPRGGDRLRFGRGVWLGSIEPIHQRMLAGAGVGLLPEYLVRFDLKNGRLRRLFPAIEPLHDYFRLVFRIDDPRRPVYEGLARSLMEKPLR